MIKVENIEVFNFEGAIRGMRNPLMSHSKSDSGYGIDGEDEDTFVIGNNDLDLMKRLYKASLNGDNHAHRKYLRQIFVSMDIIAPTYFTAELDTYKIGTTRNSCSLQHKGASRDFTAEDFSFDSEDDYDAAYLLTAIDIVNYYRQKYIETKDYKFFIKMRQLMPMGYNYRFTYTMNYENVISMIKQRHNHKLPEWREFCEILKTLPYIKEIMEE